MSTEHYIDTHALGRAFIANKLERLADMISEQGEAMLREEGLSIPARAASCMLYIGENNAVSTADVADALHQPHQLATQRVEALIRLKLVARASDPGDGRRKILKLTAKGRAQFERLQQRLAEADEIFAALFKEIDCDLNAVIERMKKALRQKTLIERMRGD